MLNNISNYWKIILKKKREELPAYQISFGNEYEERCGGNFQNESIYQRKYHIQKA